MCVVTFSKKNQYGSKKKLNAFEGKPKWGYIELTEICKHQCGWCYGGFNRTLTQSMSMETFVQVIDKLEQMGVTQISLAGGEPTEHPNFKQMVGLCKDRFVVNVVSHGDWADLNLADSLKNFGVNQVQFNFQGRQWHDKVHGVAGSYERLLSSIQSVKQAGIEVVTSMTIGAYNLADVAEVFAEMNALAVDRIRVWEATGLGNRYRRNTQASQIFEHAITQAQKLGYDYIQSYEPLVEGDIAVHCPAMSKLILWINVRGEHLFCGAVASQLSNPLSNVALDSMETILNKQAAFVAQHQQSESYCMARDEAGSLLRSSSSQF
jgi:MoaA/NifB/PqqE/SkfB family radical SAM enzyme